MTDINTELERIADETLGNPLEEAQDNLDTNCLLYTSPSPRDGLLSRMPSSA